MFILNFALLFCVSRISAKPIDTSTEAIKLAISSSFNRKINLLHIAIRTNSKDNKLTFIDMLDNILIEQQWEFKLQIDVNNEGIQRVGDYNLWFIDSYDSFKFFEFMIRAHEGDSPVFYLIFLKTSGIALNLINKIFTDMWSLMVVNINIVIEETSSDEIVFYTYFPYRKKQCYSTAAIELFRFRNNSLMLPQDFYPQKAKNLHGCTLKSTTRNPVFFRSIRQYSGFLEVGGLEIALLNELASRMNFKIEMIKRFTHEKVLFLKNGTVFGAYHLIQENKAHIMIGFYKHGPLQDRFVTPSKTYFISWVAIALSRPPYEFRKFTWLFIPFDLLTWLWCLSLIILATAGVYIVTKLPFLVRFLDLHPHRIRLANVPSIALGLSIEYLPKTNFVRLCFLIWSLGNLTIRASYEGKLFDAYRSLTGAKSPLTVRQLLAQNYTIYSQFTYAFVLNELGGIGSFNYQKLPHKKVLGNGNQTNAVISSFVYMYEIYDPQELADMIIEPLFYEYICLFMKKHSILAPRVNDIIIRMEEAGLFNCWREHYEVLKILHFDLHRDNNVREPGPIGFNQFKYTLLLFAVPVGVAILVFIFEVHLERIKQRFGLLDLTYIE